MTRPTPGDGTELRVAVAAPGTELPAWQASAITALGRLDHVSLVLFVDESPATGPVDPPALDSSRRLAPTADAGGTDWSVWDRWQRLMPSPTAGRPVDLTTELTGVETVPVAGRGDDGTVRLGDPAEDTIRAADLDVLLRLSGRPFYDDAVYAAPTYGVWEFRYGSEGRGGEWPPCLRELVGGETTTRATLWRMTGVDSGVPLRRGVYPTLAHSWHGTVDQLLEDSARWPAAVAVDIATGEAAYLSGEATEIDLDVSREPGVTSVAALALAQLRGVLRIATTGASVWSIGVTEAPIDRVAADPQGTTFEWFHLPDSRRFVADPFPVRIDDEPYLLFEDLSFEDGRGVISALSLADPLTFESTEVVFERPHHLSYPYAFVHDGRTYVAPEMAEAGEINLYALDGPADWTHVETLVPDVPGLDPTLVEHDGRWWLFCTRLDDLPQTNLYVYHAPSPLGEWVPHANNPVKTDVRSVRPAGTPWFADGTLYRPAQYCAGGYGRRVVVNRIDRLSATAFEETVVGELRPGPDDPYAAGRHTLATNGDVTVVDGFHNVLDTYHTARRARMVLGGIGSALERLRGPVESP